MKFKTFVLSTTLSVLLAAAASAQSLPSFREGERVVFSGDSITEGGRYYSYIWLFYMTRFPQMRLWMANAGVGGDTVYQIIQRLDGDILDKNPSVLTLSFGMNDTGYFEYNGDDPDGFGAKRLAECRQGWEELESRLLKLKDVNIILLGCPPYDETSKFNDVVFKGKNSWIIKVNEMLKASASDNGWLFLDFNEPLMKVASARQALDPSYTISRGDRIHPDNDNHMVMAYTFLKAQNFAGHPKVADILIDAPSQKVSHTEHCCVTGLKKERYGVEFDYLADALPYPLDTIAHDWDARKSQYEAKELIPLIEEMNSEMLTVKGLEKGRYHLYIDREDIGIFTSEQFENGVNMAELEWTPQYRQALAVMHLNEIRFNLEHQFRNFAWVQYNVMKGAGLLDANDRRAVQLYDAEEKTDLWLRAFRQDYDNLMNEDVRKAKLDELEFLVDRIYKINKPVRRHIAIRKVNAGKDWAIGPFTRMQDTPVIRADSSFVFHCPMSDRIISWMESDTFNPAAAIKDGRVCVLFRAEDNSHQGIGSRTSRIGLAESRNGLDLKIKDTPVLFPDRDNQKEYEWEGGCEDPRVAKTVDGKYVMLYTSWNRKIPRLCVATSSDLVVWKKHGPAFAKAYGGRFRDMACKSGSIVTEIKKGELVISKIKGKYLMYWGEDMVNLATSDDLINWYPLLDDKADIAELVAPRPGKFDSALTECGPPAVMTKDGIILMYNGKNSKTGQFDPNYTRGTYSAGQILFDADDPTKVLDRLDDPFFVPSASFEKSGQYPDGTVFIEGLVLHNRRWLLYYGCADSFVGLAEAGF